MRPVREHDGKEGSRRTSAVLGKPSKHAARLGGYTVKNLALLAEQVPDAYREFIASEASRRRLDWADLIAQVTGHICGLVALLILAAVSWHAIDRGASTQGAINHLHGGCIDRGTIRNRQNDQEPIQPASVSET